MKFDEVLLAVIARRPVSGYDLGRWLATDGVMLRAHADQSQIYKVLNRLVSRGDITFDVEKREGAPDAKVYSLTDTGADRIHELASAAYEPAPRWQEPDFAARYALLAAVEPDRVIELIDQELQFRAAQPRNGLGWLNPDENDEGSFALDRDVAVEVVDDLRVYEQRAIDLWTEWLGDLRQRWGARGEQNGPLTV